MEEREKIHFCFKNDGMASNLIAFKSRLYLIIQQIIILILEMVVILI